MTVSFRPASPHFPVLPRFGGLWTVEIHAEQRPCLVLRGRRPAGKGAATSAFTF